MEKFIYQVNLERLIRRENLINFLMVKKSKLFMFSKNLPFNILHEVLDSIS